MRIDKRARRAWMMLAGALIGTAPGTCEVKLHDSFVGATQAVFTGLFDPSNQLGVFLFEDAFDEIAGSQ
jgi:hypothetical protein